MMTIAYCVCTRRAAYVKATPPSGLDYPRPLLQAMMPIQDLLPVFACEGSPAPDTYVVVEGRLPLGLRLNKRTGAITGTPAVAGSAVAESACRVLASNLKGSADCNLLLQVETRAAPADLSYPPPQAPLIVGVPVSFVPALRRGIPNTNFRASDLPSGLEINAVTGVISGAASEAVALRSLTVTAFNDYGGTSCDVVLSIVEQRAPSSLGYSRLGKDTVLIVGDACSHTPAAHVGLPPATFNITPALSGGMTMDAVTGVISGTPSQPMPRKVFTVSLQNPKGKSEFKFSVEVQLHIPPVSLSYAVFDQMAKDIQGKLYMIFVCGEPFPRAMPELKQGSHVMYRVDPLLPPGLELHASMGIIAGTPTAPANNTVYTLTASNSKGSAQVSVAFATCQEPKRTAPESWSPDVVQMWAQRGLNLEAKDRECLLHLNGSKLLSLRSVDALKSELPRLPAVVHRLLLLEIENLNKAQGPHKQGEDEHSRVMRPPANAKRGDVASRSMLPLELRSDYEPICILGNGGHGTVFHAGRAVKGHIDYHVAIKIIYNDDQFQERDVKRMNKEAKLLGNIDSPYVVKLKFSSISASNLVFWLIMDYIDGMNLQELINSRKFFNEDEVCDLCMQILQGLKAVHKLGVVHCDVKPANIMQVAGSETNISFILVDLGVAMATEAASASLATVRDQQNLRGTPGFICPEIIRNQADGLTQQADIWSFGATLFAVLTGKLAFCAAEQPSLFDFMAVAMNLDEEPPDVAILAQWPISSAMSFIIRKALWKRREGRYASADEMRAAVTEFLKARKGEETREEVPVRWTQAAAGQAGGTVLMVLDPQQEEWREVVALFIGSLGALGHVNSIVQVERVQNPSFWAMYQAKKRGMEWQGGGGEQRLFHGTDEATVPKIVSGGFNRSYCGKNATAYGQGVYFARDASYSADDTYSRPNARGEKRLFLSRVLVGHCTRGDSSMRVPPARPDGRVFDSTVDRVDAPSIFVVYHDAQAQPVPSAPPAPPTTSPAPAGQEAEQPPKPCAGAPQGRASSCHSPSLSRSSTCIQPPPPPPLTHVHVHRLGLSSAHVLAFSERTLVPASMTMYTHTHTRLLPPCFVP
jgi:tRNA A-37 threonylcarbamoyl transferase component Bud32